ncbi:MAG: response regulator [Deltaproteobacteria bacterium]|jgi:CheY-like chemotaxis protein|nr:response regulator [Deltaproteobacteria bacterium]
MDKEKMLEGKRILIVDDEPDVLDTLEDLLPACITKRATSFDEAKALLEGQYFDMAILDIMGVEGYELLKICNEKHVIGVMLTAYAVTPEDIKKSFEDGAASFVPKEQMHNITTFLTDIYEAKEKGKSFWWRWFDRLADYCERKFGPDWQKKHGFKVR